jgi:hypothetical protein
MFQKILSYGAVAGLIVGVPMLRFAIPMNGHPSAAFSMAVGYLIMLIALSTVFIAIKRHRDADLGGIIKFWPAFGLGLGISVVAGVFYVLAWEATQAFTHMDFAGSYAKMMIDQFKVEYANPLYRLPMTFVEIFPVGLLVSLASAGLLRNSRFLPARRS